MKNLTKKIGIGMLSTFLLGSCATGNFYPIYPNEGKSSLKVKTQENLSLDSAGRGLTKINGKLYVICKEDGETFITDFGKNANPILVKSADGTYDVIVEDNHGKSYYDWDKKGNLIMNYEMKWERIIK